MLLVGIGYDIHRLADDRQLILGGVHIDAPFGLAGHSDADVALHAVCDALLGASGLGDIGEHFPDTDPQWKGVSSQLITDKIVTMVSNDGYRVNNIDVNIIAERPKLGLAKGSIRENIARLLGINSRMANVKAKTNEGLDAIGRGEAIAAQVVLGLCKTKN